MKNGMYSSTMEFNKPSKTFASLESMGRFVPTKNDKLSEVTEEPTFENSNNQGFGHHKAPLASSTIFGEDAHKDMDRFPAFNLHAGKKTQVHKV